MQLEPLRMTRESLCRRAPASWRARAFPLAGAWTSARSLRLADGPDEVHRGVIAKLELGKYL